MFLQDLGDTLSIVCNYHKLKGSMNDYSKLPKKK